MGDVAAAAHASAAEAREKLYECVSGNKIFCFEGEEKIKKYVAVGEHHTECQQYAVNSS